MKKNLFIFLLFFTLQCFGQSYQRSWEEGKLSWDDFKGEPFTSSAHTSELNYQLSYITVKKRIGDTILFSFQTKNYFNPTISWVKESDKAEDLLRYNQMLFDILELHRRRLQSALHRIDNLHLAEEKFRTQYQNNNHEIKQFQEDTNFGTDPSALAYWEQRISQKLSDNPLELVPKTTDRNFGYGINAGFGTGVLTGSIADFFTPTFNFMYGVDFAFKNAVLFLTGTIGVNRVKREYNEDGLLWPENLKTGMAVVDISIGQILVDVAKHKIIPFAGLGILEFTAADREGDEYGEHRFVNYGFIYGVNYDFKLQKRIKLTPPPNGGNLRERSERNLRLRLYAMSAKFENMKGSSINLTVGYALFGRIISID